MRTILKPAFKQADAPTAAEALQIRVHGEPPRPSLAAPWDLEPVRSATGPPVAAARPSNSACCGRRTVRAPVRGKALLPTLIYLPGLHGDWTLVSSFRAAVAGKVRFVEFVYPRSTTWSVEDYAVAIEDALVRHGITSGWLLAESFGSQIAWAMLGRPPDEGGRKKANTPAAGSFSSRILGSAFAPAGLILAGGFVKHPWPWGARLLKRVGARTPHAAMLGLLRLYAAYARFRHRQAPETRDSIREFVARRTPQDREAMRARLELVAANDPRPVARTATLPVFYLGGAVDPLVPWPWVRWWLRRHCPGYRGGRTCWRADHNALGTQPRRAAAIVLDWMTSHAVSPAPPSAAAPPRG